MTKYIDWEFAKGGGQNVSCDFGGGGGTYHEWETDFYTPPVLGGAAFFFDYSAPAVYKIQGP